MLFMIPKTWQPIIIPKIHSVDPKKRRNPAIPKEQPDSFLFSDLIFLKKGMDFFVGYC